MTTYDEAEVYRHASHGCTTPDNERCVYCEREAEQENAALGVSSGVLAEAARLEALVQEDFERWSATLALTAPIPSVFLTGEK